MGCIQLWLSAKYLVVMNKLKVLNKGREAMIGQTPAEFFAVQQMMPEVTQIRMLLTIDEHHPLGHVKKVNGISKSHVIDSYYGKGI